MMSGVQIFIYVFVGLSMAVVIEKTATARGWTFPAKMLAIVVTTYINATVIEGIHLLLIGR